MVGGADRLVLLGLDGGDDVPHGAAPGAGEGGHQSAFPEDREIRLGSGVEQIVLQTDDLVVAAAQHPPPDHIHGVDLGGAVEGLGGGCAPVDHQRLILGVTDPETADVAGLREAQVETAEDKSLVFRVEDGEAFGCLIGEGVTLEERGPGLLTQIVAPVGLIDFRAAAGERPGAGRGSR